MHDPHPVPTMFAPAARLPVTLLAVLFAVLSVASANQLRHLDSTFSALSPVFDPVVTSYAASASSAIPRASLYPVPGYADAHLFLSTPGAPFREVAPGATLATSRSHSLVLRANGELVAWGDNSFGKCTIPATAQGRAVALAVGDDHSLALLRDGSVLAWGNNGQGQTTVPPAAQTGIVAIAASAAQSLALRADGSVVAWGNTQSVPPTAHSGVIAIAAGRNHVLALKSDGSVISWGQSTPVPGTALADVVFIAAGPYRSLARKRDGTVIIWGEDDASLLVSPPEAQGALALATTQQGNLALRPDGSVFLWGNSPPAHLTPPSAAASEIVALSGGENHALALKPDGSLVFWGTSSFNLQSPPLRARNSLRLPANAAFSVPFGASTLALRIAPATTTRIASIRARTLSARGNHGLVLRNDGSLVTWSQGIVGTQALPYTIPADVCSISLSQGGALALRANGTLLGWRESNYPADWPSGYSPNHTPPPEATNLVDLATAQSYALALRADGRVIAWGVLGNGSTALTPPLAAQSDVIAIAASDSYALALKANGSVISWGSSTFVPSAAQSNVTAIATGRHQSLALRSDRTLVAWNPSSSFPPIPADAQNDIIDISVGETHSLALRSDGRVVAWGDSGNDLINVPAAAQSNVVSIAAGRTHSLALLANGTVVAWGSPDSSQPTPPAPAKSGVRLPGITPAPSLATDNPQVARVPLALGFSFSLALRSDGTPAVWGSSTGEVTPPAGLTNLIAVAAAERYALALSVNGSVTAWGNDTSGTLSVPAAAQSDVIGIAAGTYHALALKRDGSIVGWGNNSSGQLTPPELNPPASESHGYFFTGLAASNYASFGLRSDGRVLAWGSSSDSLTTIPIAAQSNVIAIAAGPRHALALKHDGSVVGWGSNSFGQAPTFKSTLPVIALVAAESYSAFLHANGAVSVASHHLSFAQVPAAAQSGIIAIAGGRNHITALKVDGTLVSWGQYSSSPSQPLVVLRPGPLGTAYDIALSCPYPTALSHLTAAPGVLNPDYTLQTPYPAFSIYALPFATHPTVTLRSSSSGPFLPITPGTSLAVNGFYGLAIKADGTLATPGFSQTPSPPTAARSDLISVAIGRSHYLALKRDGTVVGWSTGNSYGQATPPLGLKAAAIAANEDFSLAIESDGSLAAWGNLNSYGLSAIPIDATDLVAISAGRFHILALRRDGRVVQWGSGNLVLPPTVTQTNVVAIAAGRNYSLALSSGGQVIGWGSASAASIPPAASYGVIAIAAGSEGALALKADGSVITWGRGSAAAATVPAAALSDVVAIFASSAGSDSFHALKRDGTVVAWGQYPVVIPPDLQGNIAQPLSHALPLALGANEFTLRVTSPDALETLDYTITATRAAAPALALVPGTDTALPLRLVDGLTRHSFGLQCLATPSSPHLFTLLNSGTAELTVTAASFTGTAAAEYTLTGLDLPLILAPGASSTFTLTATPAAVGYRSAVLLLTTNLPHGAPFQLPLSTESISLATELTTWRAVNFNSAELTDPALETTLWGNLADPDADGLSNLLEYALNLTPKTPNPTPAISLDNTDPANPRLSLTYTRLKRATIAGLTYRPEWTDELGGNLWHTTGLTEQIAATTDTSETVIATVPATPPRCFLRLRVTAP